MKKAMINYMKNPKNDELYTPKEAILPLIKYIENLTHKKKDIVIWECTDFGNSEITKTFKEHGFPNVFGTHINEGFNFLNDEPNFEFDIIITNPPYSIKDKFIQRCYELNKPFCLLLPITTLEGMKRGEMFRKHGIEVLVLDKRINFMKSKKNCWFNTSWFCNNVLNEKLIFEKVVK